IQILLGLRETLEKHHQVKITDDAIQAAVALSERYIAERFLPDKAIDLVDEAASALRIEIDSMPAPLEELTRRKLDIEIERAALKKDTDPSAREHDAALARELAERNEKINALTARWQAEKEAIRAIRESKEAVDQARTEAERAERRADLERVAELRHGRIPELERRIEAENARLLSLQKDGALLKEEVAPEDVARVVSRWTGIPVARMLESEKEKLLRMEERIRERVVGQERAVRAVSDAVRRSRAGLQDPNRPLAKFIFLGPTGVGQTEVARALAAFLFDDEKSLVRIDMSEYQEKHSVARLIGAPPGYVGYEEGGQLTESVRRRPYSVVLFDEIEKAHPEVFNTLLQLLDDGRLTDGQGRTVSFTNTIVIMTSNLGSRYIMDAPDLDAPSVRAEVMAALREHFRPEFLNRIDEVIVFNRLGRGEIRAIVRIQLGRLEKRLAGHKRRLEVSDEAVELIAKEGFDPQFGARPVARAIQDRLENPIARMILSGELPEEAAVRVDAKKGEILIRPGKTKTDASD
ncbi:MAG: AAA family ATPase, partial [Planctomycetota bacterium]